MTSVLSRACVQTPVRPISLPIAFLFVCWIHESLIDTVCPISLTPQTHHISHQTVCLRLAPDVHQPAPVQLTLLLSILPGPGILREHTCDLSKKRSSFLFQVNLYTSHSRFCQCGNMASSISAEPIFTENKRTTTNSTFIYMSRRFIVCKWSFHVLPTQFNLDFIILLLACGLVTLSMNETFK